MEQYIPKAAVVAEIERRKIPFKKDIDDGVYPTYLCALMDFEDFLDTLEVKEVDLEDELNKWRHEHFHGRRDKDASGEYFKRTTQLDIAKHFFELGMTANNKEQKGE